MEGERRETEEQREAREMAEATRRAAAQPYRNPRISEVKSLTAIPGDKRGITFRLAVDFGRLTDIALTDNYTDGKAADQIHPEFTQFVIDVARNFRARTIKPFRDVNEPALEEAAEAELKEIEAWLSPLNSKKVLLPNGTQSNRNITQILNAAVASDNIDGVAVNQSNAVEFKVDKLKLFKHKMGIISKAKVVLGPDDVDVLEKLDDAPEDPQLFDMSQKGRVLQDKDGNYSKLVNGNKVPFGVDDLNNENCYGTHSKGVNQAQCEQFIFKCLLDEDPESLEQCLGNLISGDFYKVALKDISNLHPVLALRLLQKFGFRKYKAYDESARQNIYKVEGVGHWLKYFMEKKFGAVGLSAMLGAAKQDHLLNYLRFVTQYVNANPEILNPGFAGPSDEKYGLPAKSDYAKRLGLEYEVPRSLRDNMCVDINRLDSLIRNRVVRRPFVTIGDGRVVTPWGSASLSGGHLLHGGGPGCEATIADYSSKHSGTALLERFFKSAMAQLAKTGRSLDAKDEQYIKDYISRNRTEEAEILRTLCYMDEYSQLYAMFGDSENGTVINKDNLKKFVKRYEDLVGKQGNTEQRLVQMLAKLSEHMARNEKGTFSTISPSNKY